MTRPIFENPHLDGSTFFLSGSGNINILLLHGFTATTVEVRPLAKFLHSTGHSIFAPLLPGHGTRPEDLISVHWEDWYQAAEEGYKKLAEPGKKIFVGGESMGGLLSLLLAANHPEITGILLFAPALIIRGIWQAKWVAPFRKIMPKGYLKEANNRTEDQLPWQGYNVLTLPAVAQLATLQKIINARLDQVAQPILIFQGKLDGTVDAAGAQKIFNAVRSTDKTLIWLEESGHCLLLDRELNQVKSIAHNFIQRLI